MTLPAPLSAQGRVGRAKYGLTVIFATLIFNTILRGLALSIGTSRPSGLNYLLPLGMLFSPSGRFWRAFPLIAFAIYLGLLIAMTWKRLRDLETMEWYVLLLFVPVLNVLFFILLCLQPGSESLENAERQNRSFLETLIPSSTAGSAVVGALTGAITATLLGWFAVIVLGHYGSVLFLGIPVFIGYFAAWIHSYGQPRSLGECCVTGLSSIVVSGALIVGIAFEGIICVAMAMPLALPLGILGGYLAYVTQRSKVFQPQPAAMMSLLLTLPLLLGAEYLKPESVPQHVVHSSVIISAPSRIVWMRIMDLPRIEEKPHWILRLGMAYPMETRTSGTGLTAERLTTFSTGLSREPLVAWEEGKHLAFRVADEPPLMKETSPYGAINVRHLEDHDFRPGRVDFYLTEIPGGHTRVDCFSSYENRMWPGEYWQLWTDEIVRQIQLRVFRQIKDTAEAEGLQ
jgi:uncharacterized membrane protein YhaH (DUF805 family)